MKTLHSKAVGLLLIAGALAVFVWLSYEPAQIVSTLKFGAMASEAAVVIATLAIVAVSLAGGAFLLFRKSPNR